MQYNLGSWLASLAPVVLYPYVLFVFNQSQVNHFIKHKSYLRLC